MALLGLSTAQAKYAKWVIRGAGQLIPAGLAWLTNELVSNPEAPSTLEWRRFNIIWTRSSPAGTYEDKAQFKIDLVNITGDELDVTWTPADFTAVTTAVQTCVTALAGNMGNHQTFSELRAYRMRFNPVPDVLRPFAESGPPVNIATLTGTGGGLGIMPYQIAPTVTMRTAWPKHWGRSYMPTPSDLQLQAPGRLKSAYTIATGGAYKTMLGALHDGGFYPVIPVGQLNKQPFHALLAPTQVVVDDIPDVQRRRRGRQAAVRSIA